MRRLIPRPTTRLEAARTFGATAVALVALLAVATPGREPDVSHAGPLALSELTVAVGVLGLIVTIAWLYVPRLARVLGAALAAAIIAALFPLLSTEPAIASAVIVWHLLLAGAALSPLDRDRPRILTEPTPGVAREWLRRDGPAARHLLGVSMLLTLVVLGFRLVERGPTLEVALLVGVVAAAIALPFLIASARAGSIACRLAGLLLAGAALAAPWPLTSLLLLAAAHLLLLLILIGRLALFADLLDFVYEHPAALVVGSFAALIAIGTMLLSLPVASASSQPLSVIDAAFTATSAACVTGLIVVDTPRDLSTFGQGVVLALIQVGGLNIMVLSTFAALLLGRGLGQRGERALGEVLDLGSPATTYRLIRFIVLATLSIEAAGAAVLTQVHASHGSTLPEAVWLGVFHSVSAFCNAGFSLFTDSLVSLRRDPVALITVQVLIILGGLGFAVLAVMWQRGRTSAAALRIHARVAVIATVALLAIGTAAYAVMEWDRSLLGLAPHEKLLNASFQSTTLRTAGFNSVDLSQLEPFTVLWMMVFMFIGASPGGTGGGIKTTTMFILLAAVPAIVRAQPRIVLMGRTLSLELIYRSAAIMTCSAGLVLAVSLALLATQTGTFDALLFEAFSAVGTVGLSLGVTANLDLFGKIVVMLAMLGGRVGPLTLALLMGRRLESRVSYPEARIMVG